MSTFFLPIVIGLFIFALYGVIFIVKQQTAAVIETFGRFSNIRQSGFQLKVPVVQRIAGRMSLKIQQLDVIIETKTLDDVFVKLKVSVQFKVIKDKVYEAFYKLDYPHDQITSYVFDVVRAEVPKMKLDDVSTINPILVGDTIVTGGMSDYFPYGIPIGKVSSFKRPKVEGYYDIDIELFSNLTQKEFVYVLKNKMKDQLNQLKYESR